MKEIRSTQNESVKRLRALQNKKGRQQYGRFAVEGVRALRDLPAGVAPLEVYFREGDEALQRFALGLHPNPTAVPAFILDSVCDTVTNAGILAEFALPAPEPLSARPVLVADGITDPGNLGTIVRTGVAMGITDFLLVASADPFAPKTVRAGMGGVFRANFVRTATPEEGVALLNGYTVAALDMAGENIFDYLPPAGAPFALAVGSEAEGLSEAMKARANAILSIPMRGDMESLNAAVSASAALIIVGRNQRL